MTDVDLDRLADYVGGALDGTRDAATVAHLVATDPDWSHAYAEFVVADAAVRADLSVLAHAAEPMPAAVAARITAALAGLPAVDGPADDGPVHSPSHSGSLHEAAPTARRPGGRPPSGRPANRVDRRRRRWISGLSVAAAIVVFGVVGSVAVPTMFGHELRDRTTSREGAPTAGKAADAGSGAAVASGPTLLESGRDYDPRSVSGFLSTQPRLSLTGPSAAAEDGPGAAPPPARAQTQTLDGLGRLHDPAARTICLDAITRTYGGRPTIVDYARFQGAPALVVVQVGAFDIPGRQWVVVVGARCGEGSVGSNELYNGPVA